MEIIYLKIYIYKIKELVDHEDQERNQRKQEHLTRAAQFKLKAHAKDIDYQAGNCRCSCRLDG